MCSNSDVHICTVDAVQCAKLTVGPEHLGLARSPAAASLPVSLSLSPNTLGCPLHPRLSLGIRKKGPARICLSDTTTTHHHHRCHHHPPRSASDTASFPCSLHHPPIYPNYYPPVVRSHVETAARIIVFPGWLPAWKRPATNARCYYCDELGMRT